MLTPQSRPRVLDWVNSCHSMRESHQLAKGQQAIHGAAAVTRPSNQVSSPPEHHQQSESLLGYFIVLTYPECTGGAFTGIFSCFSSYLAIGPDSNKLVKVHFLP